MAKFRVIKAGGLPHNARTVEIEIFGFYFMFVVGFVGPLPECELMDPDGDIS